MKQLAVCIPTYNQPEMIREMLIRCLGMYGEAGTDVYIYDSSPDSKTESIVSEYQVDYQNIYYSRLPADTHSNLKVLGAYQEIIGMKKYAYLWLCPDYVQLTRKGMEFVSDYCRIGFDICILNYRDVEHIGEKVYTDVNLFFLDCAWHMTSYMATVIRLSAFEDVEWEKLYERYTIPERITHSHVALYFEQLAKMQKVRAVHIPLTSAHIRISPYRKDSLWKKEVFSIWCDYWPDMIYALPGRYQHKEEVIKKLGVNTGILSWNNFIELRIESIYGIDIFYKYRKKWKKLTNVPLGLLWGLAVMPVKIVRLLRQPNLKRPLLNRRLRKFCMGHKTLFIYGCGFMSQKTSYLLKELQMKPFGYVVSDSSSEKQKFHGLPVIEYGELPKPEPNQEVGIIMALNEVNTVQVMKEKQGLDCYDIFYMYRYEDIL
jgi:hypothetical protein